MRKLIYLFLTVLIVGCSGEDNGNSNNANRQGNMSYKLKVILIDDLLEKWAKS